MIATRFSCPHCQTVLRTSHPLTRGQPIPCPKCGREFPFAGGEIEAIEPVTNAEGAMPTQSFAEGAMDAPRPGGRPAPPTRDAEWERETTARTTRRLGTSRPKQSGRSAAWVWVGVAVLAFVFLGLAVFAGAWWVIGVAARQREPAAAAAPPPLKGPPQSLPRSQEPPLSEPRKDGNAEEDKAPQQPRREPRFANGEPWVGLGKGNRAPDIDGEDLDGKPFRLSDYRGKVVLVDFWVDWCVYCRQMYEHEKALVKRLADKPFALVGVNGDPSKADAKLAVQKHGLTWRSFWDGGPTGMLIHEQWAINGYPRIVILDAKGIIRYNADGMPRDLKVLDKVIDSLLDEMAKGQPDTSPGAVKETPPVEPIDKPAPKSPKAKEE